MTHALPRVAVLLAAYNGINFIEEQLRSILSQKNVDLTIFISIDKSTDSTFEWCISFSKMYPEIEVLSYGERYGDAAKNFYRLIRDVDFSSFDFISLSDQDDIWHPDKLHRAISTIQNLDLDVFSSDVMAFWADGNKKLVKKSYPQKKYDHFFEAAGPGCTYVFRERSLYSFKQFMVEKWVEINSVASHDWMIYSYCRAIGMNWFIDDKPLMSYRQHESNQVGSNFGLKAYKKRIVMIKDSWYREEFSNIIKLVHLDDSFNFSLSRVFLITHFWQLRRRPRDACALLFMLIAGIV